MKMPDPYAALRWLDRVLAAAGEDRPAARGAGARARLTAVWRAVTGDARRARVVLARNRLDRLAGAGVAGYREIAAALAHAIEAEDYETAHAIIATTRRKPDLRAEKIVSRRYGFLWICVPKVASVSLLEALGAVDPEAELITGRTLEEIVKTRPEVRGYYRFAFIRHPCHRTFSFYADKHVKLAGRPDAYRFFIEPYHGVREGMTFVELCRWLATPYGSDAFADRHWLSQHLQIRLPDGRLPDFIGRYERLDADWETVTAHLGLPFRPLPRFNVRPAAMVAEEHLDDETVKLLQRRYADDFALGGYDA